MLRRIVFVGVIGVLAFSGLACSSLDPSALPRPFLGRAAEAPQDTAADVATTIVLPQETLAMAPAISEALATPTATDGAKGAMIQLDELSQADAPTAEWPMLPAGDISTPPATLIIRFNTPTLVIKVVPTTSLPQPTQGAMPTPSVPKPIVITLPAPPPASTPIPIVISPAPTSSPAPIIVVPPAPSGQDTVVAGAPQVIWIDDMPGRPRSKVMGWQGGTSHSLFGDKDYTNRVLEFSASPGGDWLAYTTIDHSGIQQVSTTTGEQREISPKYPWWCYRFPAWSSDGALLAFVAATDSAPWVSPPGAGLWTSAPDGTDLKQAVKGLGWANEKVLLAGWHPLKQELVYALPGAPRALLPQWFSAPIDTGNPQSLPLMGTLYDVAPDGSWLLGDGFTTDWPEGRQEHSLNVLMRVPIDGSTPKVLTPACRSDIMGQISPDGSRIAFLSMPTISLACPPVSGTITYELWVMNGDGDGRHQIQIEGIIGRNSPQWSPDGSSVFYSAWDNTGSALWQADASGATPVTKLPQTEGVDRFTVVR